MKKENGDIIIKTVNESDADELLKIYAPYVQNTAITFEYNVPGIAEFKSRIINTLKKYPYLKAVRDGEIIGYAYLGEFKERDAYIHSAETSIYVKQKERRSGAGRAMYEAIEKTAKMQNILNLNACIGVPRIEDEHLTLDSVKFHEKMGYTLVGKFNFSGYKFGTWYDMIWMEKMLGEHTNSPAGFRAFNTLKKEELASAGIDAE
ncbi:MAG: N-acetyltransferase family protein [Oscillospiraceae bacterium]|nr:N-acetyltransferase family protein [Oscillospiraceae bacterium]